MLKKLISSLGNVVATVAIVALLTTSALSLLFSRKSSEKIAVLNESVRQHTIEIHRLSEVNNVLADENRALAVEINQLKATSEATAKEIKEGVQKSTDLARERPPAPEECEEIVNYMQREIDIWKDNFSLAIKDRDTWKTIAEDFDLAYQNQVAITLNLQKAMDMLSTDSLLKDDIIKELRKELKVNNLTKNIFAGSIMGLLAIVVLLGFLK